MSGYPNRKPIREAVAGLLTTALAGVAHVERYLVPDPGGKSPLVYVTSANIGPDPQEPHGGRSAMVGLQVGVMVRYAQGGVWTAEQCEALSDGIAKTIYDTVRDNTENALWSELFVSEVSFPDVRDTVGGLTYRIELIPVVARATAQ